jgi:hypothetical protein
MSTPSPPNNNQPDDPTHSAGAILSLRTAWNSLSIFGKVKFTFHIFNLMTFLLIPTKISMMLGLKRKCDVDLKCQVPNQIFTFLYSHGVFFSYCVIVKKTNSNQLFVRSPAPLTLELKEKIAKIGVVKVIEATVAHDTYAGQWKDEYPEAKVICGKDDIHIISQRVPVDYAIEDVSEWLLQDFSISQHISVKETQDTYDSFIVVELPHHHHKNVILMPCGYALAHVSPFYPLTWGYMFTNTRPFGMFITQSLIWCKNRERVKQIIMDQVAKVPNIDMLLFQHGTDCNWKSSTIGKDLEKMASDIS